MKIVFFFNLILLACTLPYYCTPPTTISTANNIRGYHLTFEGEGSSDFEKKYQLSTIFIHVKNTFSIIYPASILVPKQHSRTQLLPTNVSTPFIDPRKTFLIHERVIPVPNHPPLQKKTVKCMVLEAPTTPLPI